MSKASMHTGKKLSIAHNLRTYEQGKWNTDGHIDEKLTPQNEVLCNTDLYEFFDKNFGDALVDFNEKNFKKHPDRLIGFVDKDELKNCTPMERKEYLAKAVKAYERATPSQRRQRAVKAYYKEQKGNAQEVIFQMGNHEEFMKMVEEIGQEKAIEKHKEYLTKMYHQWLKENPSLRVFSATIHVDEIKYGTPHIHIDFLPVAESDRGLTTKVSMDGALKELGYVRKTKKKDGENDKYAETPYKRWLADERARNEEIAGEYLDITPAEPCTKKRMETWEHQQQQEIERQKATIKQQSSTISDNESYIEQLTVSTTKTVKGAFGKEKEVPKSAEELKHDKAIAGAKLVLKREAEVAKREAACDVREKDLTSQISAARTDEKQQALERQRIAVTRARKEEQRKAEQERQQLQAERDRAVTAQTNLQRQLDHERERSKGLEDVAKRFDLLADEIGVPPHLQEYADECRELLTALTEPPQEQQQKPRRSIGK